MTAGAQALAGNFEVSGYGKKVARAVLEASGAVPRAEYEDAIKLIERLRSDIHRRLTSDDASDQLYDEDLGLAWSAIQTFLARPSTGRR